VTAGLEAAAEVVGLGGHKEEAQDAIEPICKDLARLAGEPALKPLKSGKARKPYEPKALIREDVPERVLENLRSGKAGSMTYAYRWLPTAVRARYNARDAMATEHLVRELAPRVNAQPHLQRVWEKVTRPAMRALTRMEARGVLADRTAIDLFFRHLEAEISQVSGRVKAYGPDVNFDSPAQLGDLLYVKLGLPVKKRTAPSARFPQGQPSTDKETLEALADLHPIAKDLVAYNHLTTVRDTFAVGMRARIRDDGRLHTSFLIDGAGCLPAGELVLTSRGYICAEAVRVGDGVISHTGVVRRVVSTVANAPSPIYRVSLQSGHVLRTTGDHKFLTGAGEWVRADGLLRGEFVQVHSAPERWAPMQGWPFEASSWGRVRNVRTGCVLALQSKGRWGHLKVTLHRDGAQSRHDGCRKDFSVHRLVLEAFTRPNPGYEVRHMNGIAWDNTLENLRWGTSAGKRWRPEIHIIGKRATFVTSPVVSVFREPDEATYGATVEIDHSHVTGGIVTHNTGRLSSRDPNLQNIPSPDRDPVLGKMARDAFVAPRGWRLVEKDYSQLELRIAAMLAQDEVMAEMFRAGHDFHEATAKLVARDAWGVADWSALDAATVKKYRAQAKNMNFQINYDLTPEFKLARTVGCSVDKAREFVELVFGQFRALRRTIDNTVAAAKRNGGVFVYVDWEPANWRPLPGLGESGDDARGVVRNALNASWNTSVQGTAAHFATRSLEPIQRAFREEGLDAHVVLTVHDSILAEVRADQEAEASAIMSEVMTSWPTRAGIPLVVDTKTGEAWGSLQKAGK
jgi:DNA polymerase I-like protein with 3'-5' exonuclease and polymerase domains